MANPFLKALTIPYPSLSLASQDANAIGHLWPQAESTAAQTLCTSCHAAKQTQQFTAEELLHQHLLKAPLQSSVLCRTERWQDMAGTWPVMLHVAQSLHTELHMWWQGIQDDWRICKRFRALTSPDRKVLCLFNVLAVLIQRGSANAAQFTSGKQRLEQIPCIHRLNAKDPPGPGTWTWRHIIKFWWKLWKMYQNSIWQ